MDSLILIIENGIALNEVSDEFGFIYSNNSLYYTEKDLDNYLNINSYLDYEAEYSENELSFIYSKIAKPDFYYIDTNSFALFKTFVELLGEKSTLLLDNDNGRILTLDEIMICKNEDELFCSA